MAEDKKSKEPLVNLDEMAALLNVDRTTLIQWVQYRRIPFIKIDGDKIRFRSSEVTRWVESQDLLKKPRKK